jgi:hypothetical protein
MHLLAWRLENLTAFGEVASDRCVGGLLKLPLALAGGSRLPQGFRLEPNKLMSSNQPEDFNDILAQAKFLLCTVSTS